MSKMKAQRQVIEVAHKQLRRNMFKKLLLKTMKSLSPDDKKKVRDVLEETPKNEVIDEKISEIKKEEEKKGEKEIMPNEEKKLETKVEEKEVDKKEENKEVFVDDNKPETEEKVEEQVPTEQKEEENSTPQVQETEPQGNGIRIEDLVTKEELMEKLAAFEAKFDAVVKENMDLKDTTQKLQDKYENKNFGNLQRQGMMPQDKQANSSFDEYSKQFM